LKKYLAKLAGKILNLYGGTDAAVFTFSIFGFLNEIGQKFERKIKIGFFYLIPILISLIVLIRLSTYVHT
jgi:hypothetical protein